MSAFLGIHYEKPPQILDTSVRLHALVSDHPVVERHVAPEAVATVNLPDERTRVVVTADAWLIGHEDDSQAGYTTILSDQAFRARPALGEDQISLVTFRSLWIEPLAAENPTAWTLGEFYHKAFMAHGSPDAVIDAHQQYHVYSDEESTFVHTSTMSSQRLRDEYLYFEPSQPIPDEMFFAEIGYAKEPAPEEMLSTFLIRSMANATVIADSLTERIEEVRL